MATNLFTTLLLPLALATVMLGMGLGLVPEDFRRIGRDPKAVAVGTLAQVGLLPLIGALIMGMVPMPPPLAVGLMAISSLITVVTIPLLAHQALRILMGSEAPIQLPIGSTMLQRHR